MAGKITIEEIKKILNCEEKIKNKYKSISFDTFIETGTHYGSTIFSLYPFFKELHTIELSENFYNICKQRSIDQNIKNIVFHLGSSDILIRNLCENIKKPLIFFLDSHWSKDNTAKGDVEVPLLNELESIKKRNENDILIIDDLRLFGTKNPDDVDWSEITVENILKILDKNVFATMEFNDRYIVFLKQYM
jgi:hypothetical protein